MRLFYLQKVFVGIVLIYSIFGRGQAAIAAELSLRATGPFSSNKVKNGKADSATQFKTDFIDVRAFSSVNERYTTVGCRLSYTIVNRSTETIKIQNPIPFLDFSLTNKQSGAVVSPRSPASSQDQSRIPKLNLELARNDVIYSVLSNKFSKDDSAWSLEPRSNTVLTIDFSKAAIPASPVRKSPPVVTDGKVTITFPNSQARNTKRVKVPFSQLHGEYNMAAAIRIALYDDPDVSFVTLFDGNFKL